VRLCAQALKGFNPSTPDSFSSHPQSILFHLNLCEDRSVILLALLLAQIGTLFLLSRVLDRRLSALFRRIFKNEKVTVWLMALLFLPGTFVHELAHLVVARVLLVRAGHLTVIPKNEGDHIVMGSVLVPRIDRVRKFIIGVAPVVVGLALIFGLMWFGEKYGWWEILLWQVVLGYVVFELANCMFSSRADMEGALGLFALLAIIFVIAYWLGWRPELSWVEPYLNSEQGILGQAVQWLWWPVGIDVVAVAMLWSANK
jgi:hypothetical protein